MLTLGRLAALTASVEHSTEQRESERRLSERVELTRELHENAIQRLFGVALALGSERGLSAERAAPLPGGAALGRRRPAPRADPAGGDAAAGAHPGASPRCWSACSSAAPSCGSSGRTGSRFRPTSSRVAQSVLAEALRNADRHSQPSRIEVRVASDGDTFSLAVENDGAGDGQDDPGRRPRAAAGGAGSAALRGPGRVRRRRRRSLARPPRRPGRRPDGAEGGKLRVLVVDDHDVVQWGFRLLLERQSWVERCLAASDGAEAVDICRAPAARGGAGRHAARQRVRGRGLRGDPRASARRRGCC